MQITCNTYNFMIIIMINVETKDRYQVKYDIFVSHTKILK